MRERIVIDGSYLRIHAGRISRALSRREGGELITEGSTKDLDPSAAQFRPIVLELSPPEIVRADENASRANAESISFTNSVTWPRFLILCTVCKRASKRDATDYKYLLHL